MSAVRLKVNNIPACHLHGFSIVLPLYFYSTSIVLLLYFHCTSVRLLFTGYCTFLLSILKLDEAVVRETVAVYCQAIIQ